MWLNSIRLLLRQKLQILKKIHDYKKVKTQMKYVSVGLQKTAFFMMILSIKQCKL